MEIIGFVAYIVLGFIAVVWMIGIRMKPVVYPTVNMGLYFLVLFLIFTLGDFNKVWLLLWIPLGYLLVFIIPAIFVNKTPILYPVLRITGDLYGGILRIGIKKDPL